VVALGWWALPLTRSGAGVEPWVLVPAALACLPLLLLAGTPRLRPVFIVVALAPGVVALLLNPVSRTGWSGLDVAATWLYAGLLGLGVLAYARSPRRRLLVVSILGVAALDQFGQGWLAWWGGGDVSALMTGTVGWHNPFAAFVAAPLLVGWCLVMRGRGAVRLGAALLVPWLGAAVLLSGSRATIGLVLLGALTLVLFAVRSWGEVIRLGGAVSAAPAAVWLLSSSWLMPLGSAVTNTALGRDEAAGGNLVLRAHYDWAGLQLAGQHPLTGAGFDSYGPAGAQYMPADIAASSLVHNGWIQGLVDGGLLLALPLVLATGWPALRALRRVVTGRRAGANAIQLGVSLAALVLLGHALFDIDWQYPSLVALYAITAALLPWRSRRSHDSPTASGATGVVLAVTVGTTVVVSLVSTAMEFPGAAPPAWVRPVEAAIGFRSVALGLPTAAKDGAQLLAAATFDQAEFGDLMARTAAPAADDPALAQTRALALVQRGQIEQGLALSTDVLPATPRPPVILLRADVLAAAGEADQATEWVVYHRDRIQSLQGNVPTTELDNWLASHATAGAHSGTDGRSDAAPRGEAGL